MSYLKLRTYWEEYQGSRDSIMYSKAQYIVISSINGFSDVYKQFPNYPLGPWKIDIDTKEHETKTLYYYDKEEAEDALQQLINAFTQQCVSNINNPT